MLANAGLSSASSLIGGSSGAASRYQYCSSALLSSSGGGVLLQLPGVVPRHAVQFPQRVESLTALHTTLPAAQLYSSHYR